MEKHFSLTISSALSISLPLLGFLLLGADSTPVDVAPLGKYTEAERRHWAFQPRKDVKPPALSAAIAKAWIRAPVDAFILEGLRKAQLKPAPEADRATPIRRVTYDLHGLPPTPEEIAAFATDKSPKAYENLIDRLLAWVIGDLIKGGVSA